MVNTDTDGVNAAFEILLEEIERVIEEVNQAGARAFADAKLDAAEEVLGQARTLTAYRSRIAEMRSEWASLYESQDAEVREIVSRKDLGRLRKGLRTPETAYYVPILQALEELGGHGDIGVVLDRVYDKMKGALRKGVRSVLWEGITVGAG